MRPLVTGDSMYYGNIKGFSIENGVGVRVSLFVSGCRNHCKNCFSPQTWDFSFGNPFTEETVNQVLEELAPDHIHGLTILGGEPFEPENQKDILPLIRRVRQELPQKSIWMYTGFTYEELTGDSRGNCGDLTREILENIDVLVDGRFVEEKKNLCIRFRGSENQRIIDMKETLKTGGVVLKEELMRERPLS